ncbi:MAG: hypothetical protein IJ300_06915 [Clostridia bacterium]|nr:hypothetical protein [Clostridia bacterium]
MAHELQTRYGTLVDEKLRMTLVTKDNIIFNNRYEGDATAGAVKIPVRDTEVEVSNYDRANGVDAKSGSTNYETLVIDQDKAVNEIIDGYEADAVPDKMVAERLDSAGYALGLDMDTFSIRLLEKAGGTGEVAEGVKTAKVDKTKTAATSSSAYKTILAAKSYLGRIGVPKDGRWLIVSPEFHATLLEDDKFIRQGDLSQEILAKGAVGQIAGFLVFESNNLMFEDTEFVEGKKVTTEFIAGHPNWCHRVSEWKKEVALQSLEQSGKYIGASAVQGRKVFGGMISKPETLYIKRTEV